MKALFAALFLFTSLAQAAPEATPLAFAEGRVVALASWVKGPHTGAESVLRIEWKDENLAAIAVPGAFKVVLWMPSMNHGSSPTLVQPALDEQGQALLGQYVVSRVYFTMGGAWQVNITLQHPGGAEETQALSVVLKGGHHH